MAMLTISKLYLPMCFLVVIVHASLKSSDPTPCPGSHPSQRKLIDCQIIVPHYVSVICRSWNTVGLRINETYSSLPNWLKSVEIECQRGIPFYLDQSQLDWTNQVYEITTGNRLFIEELPYGINKRHGFFVKIELKNALKILGKEVYKFYTHEKDSKKDLTEFTILVDKTNMITITDKDEENGKSATADKSNWTPTVKIQFKNESTIECKGSDGTKSITNLTSLSFSETQKAQSYIECYYRSKDKNECKRECKDDCQQKSTDCSNSKNSCELNAEHENGVIICSTTDAVEVVEFFTALDNFKYILQRDDDVAIDKLWSVKLEEGRQRLFYPGQWITIKYEKLPYRFPGSIYLGYKFKNGILGTYTGEDVILGASVNDSGTAKLKMLQDVRKLYFFVPESPYDIGSALNVMVVEKQAPFGSKNVSQFNAIGSAGKQLELTCDFYGNPLPDLKWTFGNKDITSEQKGYTLLESTYENNKVSILRIETFTKDDQGKYTCIAKNVNGQSIISWEVGIEGIGYEVTVGIILIIVGAVLVGAVCYQIWAPPPVDEM